jgi:hypothetical protein
MKKKPMIRPAINPIYTADTIFSGFNKKTDNIPPRAKIAK